MHFWQWVSREEQCLEVALQRPCEPQADSCNQVAVYIPRRFRERERESEIEREKKQLLVRFVIFGYVGEWSQACTWHFLGVLIARCSIAKTMMWYNVIPWENKGNAPERFHREEWNLTDPITVTARATGDRMEYKRNSQRVTHLLYSPLFMVSVRSAVRTARQHVR